MREAYDLSFATAITFFQRKESVQLVGMDDLAFKHPVPIGSILEFTSEVVFTSSHAAFDLAHVEVHTRS